MVKLLTEIIKLFNSLIELFENVKKDRIINNKKSIIIKEEKKAVDCLDFLEKIEKNNKSVIPYELLNEYTIEGEDLICKRSIYCKSAIDNFSAFEFYIVSSRWNDFDKNKYYCLDLNSQTKNQIEAELISYNGYAKKLSFLLNQHFNKNEDVRVQLNYINKGCLSDKRCYIITDTKYKKLNLNKYTVIIRFKKNKVENIRIYLINNNKRNYTFLKRIFPINEDNDLYMPDCTTFVHNVDVKEIKNNTSLVYYFDK